MGPPSSEPSVRWPAACAASELLHSPHSALSTGRSSRETTQDGPSTRRTGPGSRGSSCRGQLGAQVGLGDGGGPGVRKPCAQWPPGQPVAPAGVSCRLQDSGDRSSGAAARMCGPQRWRDPQLQLPSRPQFHTAPDGWHGYTHGWKPLSHYLLGFWVFRPMFKHVREQREAGEWLRPGAASSCLLAHLLPGQPVHTGLWGACGVQRVWTVCGVRAEGQGPACGPRRSCRASERGALSGVPPRVPRLWPIDQFHAKWTRDWSR